MEQALLNELKTKRESWKQCLSGEDRNSIINQIYRMTWNAAVFTILNEARRIVPINANRQIEMNGMVFRFMDDCFFESQFLAIRRLTDDVYGLDGRKGVFSLPALLKDMKTNSNLMTRENLFLAEGLEYNYENIREREIAFMHEQNKNGVGAVFIPPELDSFLAKTRHEQVDFLSGVRPDNRTKQDTICIEIFDYLIQKIESVSNDIGIQVNKYIAHSATPESRACDNADEITIVLNQLKEAHKVICQIANFIDIHLLSSAPHFFTSSAVQSFRVYGQAYCFGRKC